MTDKRKPGRPKTDDPRTMCGAPGCLHCFPGELPPMSAREGAVRALEYGMRMRAALERLDRIYRDDIDPDHSARPAWLRRALAEDPPLMPTGWSK